MLAKTNSFALNGVKGFKIDIEIDINAGLPSYDTVGLPDTAIKESREDTFRNKKQRLKLSG